MGYLVSTLDPDSPAHGDDKSMAAKLIARKLGRPASRLALLMARQTLHTATVYIALRRPGYGGSNRYSRKRTPLA